MFGRQRAGGAWELEVDVVNSTRLRGARAGGTARLTAKHVTFTSLELASWVTQEYGARSSLDLSIAELSSKHAAVYILSKPSPISRLLGVSSLQYHVRLLSPQAVHLALSQHSHVIIPHPQAPEYYLRNRSQLSPSPPPFPMILFFASHSSASLQFDPQCFSAAGTHTPRHPIQLQHSGHTHGQSPFLYPFVLTMLNMTQVICLFSS
ncbi:unnamed protein product [Diplocarpon coronariae]|nr:hypothetical protein JHW43_002768 [Diplocarpon mali]